MRGETIMSAIAEKRISARIGIDGHESDGVWQRGEDQPVHVLRTAVSQICVSASKIMFMNFATLSYLQRYCISRKGGKNTLGIMNSLVVV
jgi:hypothetical protein